jgi:TPR repeat protein
VVGPTPSADESRNTPPAVTTTPTEPGSAPADAAALLARGDALFSKGDLVAARLFYERAADAGEGQAALRLGETFDPNFLNRIHLVGVRGDTRTALSWYRRARDLGAAEAEILLNNLQAK